MFQKKMEKIKSKQKKEKVNCQTVTAETAFS